MGWGELYQTFNRRLAETLTAGVSTMECAYLFMLLAFLGFPYGGGTPQQYVQWVSQTFIQLVMLSVISVQQKIMSDQQATHHQAIKDLHEKFDQHIARKTVTRKRGTHE